MIRFIKCWLGLLGLLNVLLFKVVYLRDARDAKISQSKILLCTIKRKIQHEKKLRTNIIVFLIKLKFSINKFWIWKIVCQSIIIMSLRFRVLYSGLLCKFIFFTSTVKEIEFKYLLLFLIYCDNIFYIYIYAYYVYPVRKFLYVKISCKSTSCFIHK